jgi:D-arabinose 5-phosphate isomerase GutQ
MTSLFEQSLYVLLEAIVLMLMERLGQTEAMMQKRHFNLER